MSTETVKAFVEKQIRKETARKEQERLERESVAFARKSGGGREAPSAISPHPITSPDELLQTNSIAPSLVSKDDRQNISQGIGNITQNITQGINRADAASQSLAQQDESIARLQDLNRHSGESPNSGLADLQRVNQDLLNVRTQLDPRIAQGINRGASALATGVGNIASGVGDVVGGALSRFAAGFSQPARMNEARIQQLQSYVQAQQVQMRLQQAQTALRMFEVQEAQTIQQARMNYPKLKPKLEMIGPLIKGALKQQQAQAKAQEVPPPTAPNEETISMALEEYAKVNANAPELQFNDLDELTMAYSQQAQNLMLRNGWATGEILGRLVENRIKQSDNTKSEFIRQSMNLPPIGGGNNVTIGNVGGLGGGPVGQPGPGLGSQPQPQGQGLIPGPGAGVAPTASTGLAPQQVAGQAPVSGGGLPGLPDGRQGLNPNSLAARTLDMARRTKQAETVEQREKDLMLATLSTQLTPTDKNLLSKAHDLLAGNPRAQAAGITAQALADAANAFPHKGNRLYENLDQKVKAKAGMLGFNARTLTSEQAKKAHEAVKAEDREEQTFQDETKAVGLITEFLANGGKATDRQGIAKLFKKHNIKTVSVSEGQKMAGFKPSSTFRIQGAPGQAVVNKAHLGIAAIKNYRAVSSQLRKVMRPQFFGAAGKLRQGVFNLVQQADAWGTGLWRTAQEQLAVARAKGSGDENWVTRMSDKNQSAASLYQFILTVLLAQTANPDGRISDQDFRKAEAFFGGTQWLSNMRDYEAKLDALQFFLDSQEAGFKDIIAKASGESSQPLDLTGATNEELNAIIQGISQ